MSRRTLIGILTYVKPTGPKYFEESNYFRQLAQEGNKMGIDTFVFGPANVNRKDKRIHGFQYNFLTNKWGRKWFPYPDIAIDRYRNMRPHALPVLIAFRKEKLFPFTAFRLANKLNLYTSLMKEEKMRKWLPDTVKYTDVHSVVNMLKTHPTVFVKPARGTGGISILRVKRATNGFVLNGRDKRRRYTHHQVQTAVQMAPLLQEWIGDSLYIVQQGIPLPQVNGRVYDFRILIQKTEMGQWDITGTSARLGPKKSVTSNIHGGGEAVPPEKLLALSFSTEKTKEIIAELETLAYTTAQTCEVQYGKMMELGLDVGIDEKGHPWIIEVNTKPGRSVFKKMGQLDKATQVIQRPLKYALYLLKQKQS